MAQAIELERKLKALKKEREQLEAKIIEQLYTDDFDYLVGKYNELDIRINNLKQRIANINHGKPPYGFCEYGDLSDKQVHVEI